MNGEEIDKFQDGILENCLKDELPALFYAQHWVATQGKNEPEIGERLLEEYSEETVKAIDLTLQTIQMGSLLGKTMDYFFCRLWFGRIGTVSQG